MRAVAVKNLRAKLRHEPAIGSWVQLASPSVCEIMGSAGYDWIVIDMEHGEMGRESLGNMIRAIERTDCVPLVRVSEASRNNCRIAMDAGAAGIIVPDIRDEHQLRDVISWAAWPPAGNRGVGYCRANLFGKHFAEYRTESQQPFVVAQVEHYSGVDNLQEITMVAGLDGILIGPYDLSASLGVPGEFDSVEFRRYEENINRYLKNSKVPYGDHVVIPEKEELERRINKGQRFIAFGVDAVFLYKNCDNPVNDL
jgi:2-dehydro-3-deoxyglucarate aldolase